MMMKSGLIAAQTLNQFNNNNNNNRYNSLLLSRRRNPNSSSPQFSPYSSVPMINNTIVFFKPPHSSTRLFPLRCSAQNNTSNGSPSSVVVDSATESPTQFNVAAVGTPFIPPPSPSTSLSEQAFFLFPFISCTTSVAFMSLVVAAVPALHAMGRAAISLSKLADTAREELPSTMAAIRLSGMEISDLTLELNDLSQEIAEGVNKSAQAVQAAEAGIRQIGSLARHQTMSIIQERANLPVISLQPVVAGAAKQTSRAVGNATKRVMNIISRGEFSSDNEETKTRDRLDI